ncbi:MAG: hypothetical protein SFW35_00655 [Chitinophagales bacterium]|nr:hypothetical protein [Chitinophagales bacterium]
MSTVEYKNENTNNGGGKKTVYIVIIALLVLLNVFFIWKSYSTGQQVVVKEQQYDELRGQYEKLNADLDAQIKRYEEMKGDNAALDSVLSAKIAELEVEKQNAQKALKQSSWSDSQRKKLEKQYKEASSKLTASYATIDSLQNELGLAKVQIDTLNRNLTYKTAEGEKMKGVISAQQQKIDIASLLRPQNVKISGVRYKGSGKELETTSAKKVEKLKFCFDVPENEVAEAGEKTLYVKLMNPKGETISVESLGSGSFDMANGSGTQKYTTKATFDYSQKQKNICVFWSQSAAYSEGIYKAEFYQNGTLVGKSQFELK